MPNINELLREKNHILEQLNCLLYNITICISNKRPYFFVSLRLFSNNIIQNTENILFKTPKMSDFII